jgi:hypothetical protein
MCLRDRSVPDLVRVKSEKFATLAGNRACGRYPVAGCQLNGHFRALSISCQGDLARNQRRERNNLTPRGQRIFSGAGRS